MGLFNKHKDEKSDMAPPAAPPVSSMSAPSMNMADLSGPPKPEIEPLGSLSSPPVPGGGLGDIKSEVTSSGSSSSGKTSESDSSSGDDDFNLDDDSLFDFSELELPSSTEDVANPNAAQANASAQGANQVQQGGEQGFVASRSSGGAHVGPTGIVGAYSHDVPEGTVDTNIDNVNSLNFVSNKDVAHRAAANDTYFVTTSQFKSLLEIVDAVKERVKISSDTHLRLLDIKSEEDIEFENMRKDFQFIEDKLYEVDSIIFDK